MMTAKKQARRATKPAAKPKQVKRAAAPPPVKKTEVKITAAKGRPMLTWVGKRPLTTVTAFPAQAVEKFAPAGGGLAAGKLWRDWPGQYPPGGLLFHGDNKEVLAHLLANGFRGKVNLIYIDPPFDSGADYVRKVTLRGAAGSTKVGGESYTLGEQIQYTDIWANDNYLQFMYERLMLLKELLAQDGVIILHCDWKKNHHLRCLLDEVLAPETFRNEIYWYFYNKMHDDRKGIFPRATNSLLVYAKSNDATFHHICTPRAEVIKQLRRVKVDGILVNLKDELGQLVYQESDTKTLDNIWTIPLIPPADVKQKTDYPTQKPEALLELVQLAYSNPGDIVLDCFIGSGTTAAVAQKLGRRWIACDINKGAIQTTAKRLQTIISEQLAAQKNAVPALPLGEAPGQDNKPAQTSFSVWRVNDYDLAIQHNEAVNLACEHIGVERTRADGYFDGVQGKKLVKIIPLGHPLTPLDCEEIKRELDARPDEDRAVMVVCLGMELAARAWIDDWNRLRKAKDAANRIEVVELRTDQRYGAFIRHEPAKARVKFARNKETLKITIEDFISPSIMERLRQQAGVVAPKIDDWRAMVDSVMIDTAYDGTVFKITHADIPEKKSDYVQGAYELPVAAGQATIAVKITDMLGQEVLICQKL